MERASDVRIKVGILRKPQGDVVCDERYEIGKEYEVCISGKMYHVYDKVSELPDVDLALADIESRLLRFIGEEKMTPDEMFSQIDERFRHIIRRHYYGYGSLEPLFMDPDIVDIHCVLGAPVQVVHRRHGYLITNISLELGEMTELVMRIASLAGKSISEANPVVSFIEPVYDSRVTVVYHSDITLRRGMAIDVRKQPQKPWTALKLIEMGTATPEEVAFLWLCIKYKVPIMIIGELMSGKTTFANAILNLVPPNSRVMTIEDTPELKLHTPYWIRSTTRESRYNPVRIFDLIKVAVRLTVDYIVIGEVRGEEAREWAQAILLGHGGLTTFHAESPDTALIRLTNPPIRVNPDALRLLSVFVKMLPIRINYTGELVRRSEVYVNEGGSLVKVFSYDPATDSIALAVDDPLGFSFTKRIALAHGVTEEHLRRELRAMVLILRGVLDELRSNGRRADDIDYRELPHLLYGRLREALGNETL